MSFSESDPIDPRELETFLANEIARTMRNYEKAIINKDLESSPKLYEIALREVAFWQQVYFDWFNHEGQEG